MKKIDREYTDLGIAFLDVISCGFGAIIMLVILAKDTPVNSLKQESILEDLSDYQQKTDRSQTKKVVTPKQTRKTLLPKEKKQINSKNKSIM